MSSLTLVTMQAASDIYPLPLQSQLYTWRTDIRCLWDTVKADTAADYKSSNSVEREYEKVNNEMFFGKSGVDSL